MTSRGRTLIWRLFKLDCSELRTLARKFRINQKVAMLNILLSALMDRERHMWTFRRNDRLASILVRIVLADVSVLKCSVSVTFMHLPN